MKARMTRGVMVALASVAMIALAGGASLRGLRHTFRAIS